MRRYQYQTFRAGVENMPYHYRATVPNHVNNGNLLQSEEELCGTIVFLQNTEYSMV